MVVWAALYSCAKAPWLWSIWILNIQCSKQCPKYTGWMGLLSDHRGSTVHYRLKLPISFLSHSPCLRHPHLLSPLSVCPPLLHCLHLSFHLPPSTAFISVNIILSFRVVFLQPSLSLSPCLLAIISLLCVAFVHAYLSGYFIICFSLDCIHWDFATVAARYFSPCVYICLSAVVFWSCQAVCSLSPALFYNFFWRRVTVYRSAVTLNTDTIDTHANTQTEFLRQKKNKPNEYVIVQK